ncbi:MAG: hypothetical protein AAGA56_07845 [Myxococcota bacterium]
MLGQVLHRWLVRVAVGCGLLAVPASLIGCLDPAEGADAPVRGADDLIEDPRPAEAVLAALPTEMRDHAVLIEDSGCLHRAAPEHPRMVLFSADGRRLAAFSSDPDDPRFDEVMWAELQADGFWQLATSDPEEVERAPEDCNSCHGQPSRPIWDAYPEWQGVMGDAAGRLNPAQRDALAAAFDDREHRLHALELAFDEHEPSLRLASRFYDVPATTLNLELGTAVAEGLAHRIATNTDAARLTDWFLDDQCRGATDEAVTESVAALDADLHPTRHTLYRRAGIEAGELNLGRDDRATIGTWNAGAAELHRVVTFLLVDALVAARPALSSLLADGTEGRERMREDWWLRKGPDRRQLVQEGWEVRLAPSEWFETTLGVDGDPRREAFCRALVE